MVLLKVSLQAKRVPCCGAPASASTPVKTMCAAGVALKDSCLASVLSSAAEVHLW